MPRQSILAVLPTLIVGLAAAAITSTPAVAAAGTDRFALAGGCYDLGREAGAGAIPDGQKLRLQATDLGSYLLVTPAGTFLSASGTAVAKASDPSPAADWIVREAGSAYTLSPRSDQAAQLRAAPDGTLGVGEAGPQGRFVFTVTNGCFDYPESGNGATGRPKPNPVPFGEVSGWLDGHTHWMQFSFLGGRFKCGRPWHSYGVAFALPDCEDVHGPMGSTAGFQNFLTDGSPVAPHPTDGWPTLSRWNRTTVGNSHEGLYWRWVERAWLNGERLMAMTVNENRVLCQLVPSRSESCDEMTTVRRAIRDVTKLQDYVDAQAGGPGKGFFEIVRDPIEARRVINEGRMAVVLEIEVSELFGCRGYEEQSTCTRADVDRGLDEVYDLGVRSMLLLNKFDSPLAGVRFDGGPVGLALINSGNHESSGAFWSARTCEEGELRDNTIETGNAISGELNTTLGLLGVGTGTLPTYPPGPHCNTRGLTQLGAHVVRRMIDKGMIVNPDHMSQRAVEETITIAESRRYSGVISPHGWMDPGNFPRIWALGGVAMLGGGTVDGHVERWKHYRPKSTPFPIGWGLGTDIGGLFAQPGPSPKAKDVTYPFTSADGAVRFDKLTVGKRTFDYATEGIANYGLYADWVEDLRRQADPAVVRDFMGSSEAYLGMWERSVGVPGPECRPSRAVITARGLGALRLRAGAQTMLQRAGQPQRRTRAWTYCVAGTKGAAGVTAVFTPGGTVGLVASTARGHRAGGVAPGARAAALRGRARRVSAGVWVGGRGRTRFVYRVAKGRVHTVAVTTRSIATRPGRLAPYLRLVARRVAPPQPLVLADKAPAAVSARAEIPALEGRRDLDPQQLVLLCSLLGR
jgi:hypothetical protein